MKTIKYCFSYIRFSSKKQSAENGGSSVDRQAPIAERVAKEQGWIYRPEFNAQSLGVSAYAGDNVKTIQAIIAARKSEKIPAGSVLILEALDRATRLELDDAYQLIRSILKSGLEVYTDINKRHLTAESLNKATDVMLTVVELDAAFQYSDRLSNRSLGGLNKKISAIERGEKVYMGGLMPSYIRGVENGKFVIDEKRMNLVKRIFGDYLEGKAMTRIACELNQENTPGLKMTRSTKWAQATVRCILANSVYTGDFKFKGKVYEGYLPALVTKKEFARVQQLIKQNKFRAGGSPEGIVNSVFNGIGKCSVCGGPMTAITSVQSGKKYSYYGCSSARFKKCTAKGWLNTQECEFNFYSLFLQDNPLNLIKKNTPAVKDETVSIKVELAEVEKAIGDATKLLGKIKVTELEKTLTELQTKRETLEHQLAEVTARMMTTEQVPTAVTELTKLARKMNRLFDDKETRQQIKMLIPQLAKEIRFDVAKGGYTIINHKGEVSQFYKVK